MLAVAVPYHGTISPLLPPREVQEIGVRSLEGPYILFQCPSFSVIAEFSGRALVVDIQSSFVLESIFPRYKSLTVGCCTRFVENKIQLVLLELYIQPTLC